MSAGNYQNERHLLSCTVDSEKGVQVNDSGIEDRDLLPPETRHLTTRCDPLNPTQSGTQDANVGVVPLPLPSSESLNSSDSPSSDNGSPVFCLPLDSLCLAPENNGYCNSHLTSCKSQAQHFWRKCFCCISPPSEESLEESPIVDSESSPVSGCNKSHKTQKKINARLDSTHSFKHSNETVHGISLNNFRCKSPVKLNEHDPSDDSIENVFIAVNTDSVINNSEITLTGQVRRTGSPVRVPSVSRSNSCSAQLSLTPVRVYRGSCGDYNEVSLLKKNDDVDCSSSDGLRKNKKNATVLDKKIGSFNLKSFVDCMNVHHSANKSFRKNRVSSTTSVTSQNGTFNSETCNLQDSNYVEPNFRFGNTSITENSKLVADGVEQKNLVCLPMKFSNAQNMEGKHSTCVTNILNSNQQSVFQEIPTGCSDLASSSKITCKSNLSFVESFTEPSQHFNMSAIHKDIKLKKLKSEELPSFHSPSSPTSFQLNSAATTTSTPLRACRSILAVSRLKNTPSPPVTPIRSQRTIETSLEYPLERLVRKDKTNEMQQQDSSLFPNMSFVNPDRSNSYSLAPSNFSNLTNQSESYDSDDVQFVMDGSVIRKIDFSEEIIEANGRDVANTEPWLQTLLSRTLDSTELRMCTLACQMAWELQEKVYSEIYERLSHMETYDEHFRIEETCRYKYIYLDKIERLWHFLVPLLEEKYWNRRSLKVVNKNLLIYGNRRLNAKQWEFANYNNCVFDIQCVFNYGLYAFDTKNPVFHKNNVHHFLLPNYNPEVSSEEANK